MAFMHPTRETKPRQKPTIVQALDLIAAHPHPGWHATVYDDIYLRHPFVADGVVVSRVLTLPVRPNLPQIVAGGVPLFDLRPLGAAVNQWLKLPLICVPPHVAGPGPYEDMDYAPIEYVARLAREIGVVVVNVP